MTLYMYVHVHVLYIWYRCACCVCGVCGVCGVWRTCTCTLYIHMCTKLFIQACTCDMCIKFNTYMYVFTSYSSACYTYMYVMMFNACIYVLHSSFKQGTMLSSVCVCVYPGGMFV